MISFATAGVGAVSPGSVGTSANTTIAATARCNVEPSSSGSAYISGTWQLLVQFTGSSSSAPTLVGYIQYGWNATSAAYAHNNVAGGSASGSSYTYDTSNSASVGVGTSNPLDDYYYSVTPDPSTYISLGATMSGSGSSWTYVQDLMSTEAYATGLLSGTLGAAHNIGSASSDEAVSLSYSNITVTTH